MRNFVLFLVLVSLSGFVFPQNTNISNGLAFEGEPYITLNPNDNQHLIVAWMGFKLGQEIIIKTKSTFDGGQNWSPVVELSHQQSGYGSADPSVQFDNNGNAYLCYIDYDNDNYTGGEILVAKSTDGGLSWNTPVNAINTIDCPNKLCIDRPWITIDNSGGLLDGTIYVTSMNANQPSIVSPPYNPYFTVSTDGGSTFSTPRFLDTIGYYSGNSITAPMPTPTVGADGTFYAIYPSYETSQSVFAQYIMTQSSDAGNSLDHNVTHQATSGLSSQLAKKAPLLISSPNVATHLAYLFLKEDNGDIDVYYSESFDFGSSWSTSMRVNDDPVSNGVMQDLIWADFNENSDVVVCWRDRRNGGTGYDVPTEIMGAFKFSDSTNFTSNFTISDELVNHNQILEGAGNDFLSVQYTGDTIHVVWGDTRSGVLNIYYNRIVYDESILSTDIQTLVKEEFPSQLYPNPATTIIHFPKEYNGENYEVLNGNGMILMKGAEKYNSIDISSLPKGKYYLRFKSTSGNFKVFKFLK